LRCRTECLLEFLGDLAQCLGVSSKVSTSAALSCAICSLICWSNTRIFSNSFSRFLSTLLRHTKVYLFALDSIFVPSRYSTSSVTKPFSTNINTKRVNIRSEEHTSELQSRFELVCRLPL